MSTPTTEQAREAYGHGVIKDAPWTPDPDADFDEWLRAVKAEVWNEGFDTGYDRVLVEKSIEPGAGDLRVNPYEGDPEPSTAIGSSPADSLTIREVQP